MSGRYTGEYDVVVAGGGPAGLMAGVRAGQRGLRVLVAEKMDTPCRKLRITGKGRCNVANNCDRDEFLRHVRNGARFLYSSYTAFDAQAVMRFFEERGVPLKTERGARVYPQSDRADDIARALTETARASGCDIRRLRLTGVQAADGAVRGVRTPEGDIACRAAIVATGGLSYPKTGSTGDGYRFAEAAGHNVIPPQASLVPLTCGGDSCGRMAGLSLRNVRLTARRNGAVMFSEQGEMLFTHFGVSGPLVLQLSAALVGLDLRETEISLDLKPALERQALDKRLLRDFNENINREFRNCLDALLPQSMGPVVVEQSGIAPGRRVHSITAAQRAALLELLKAFPLPVDGRRPIDEAVVTAGGVALSEIDPKSMMSKKIENLHFAGEVLDADGYTGGFNLGIAFATGHAAGSFVLKGRKE